MNAFKKSILILSLLLGASWVDAAERSTELYNLTNDVGLKGQDPVSYFPEGGDRGARGQTRLNIDYMNVTYLFKNSENQEIFFEAPYRYEPTYGGWCAWAMSNNRLADIDVNQFTIHENRFHFFASAGAKLNFDLNLEENEVKADRNWKRRSGEEPRY